MIKKALCLSMASTIICNTAIADQTSPVLGIHHKTPSLVTFTNATIVAAPGTTLPNATLIINNGHIESIGRKLRPAKGSLVIDLTGYTIYPGFIDAYSQYGIDYQYPETEQEGTIYRIDRVGGNAANSAIHAQMNWVDHFSPDTVAAKDYIANGFTSLQVAKHDGLLQGRGAAVSLATGLANDLIYNPKTQHFGSFDKGSSAQRYPTSLMGSIALLRQSFSDANWYQHAYPKGVNLNGERIEYNAALDAIADIEQQGALFTTNNEHSLLRAATLLNEFDITPTLLTSGFEYSRLTEISGLKANLVVPLNFADKPTLGQSQGRDIDLADLRHWERSPSNLAALATTSLNFAITSDGIDSDQFLPNLRQAIKHGLSQKKALAALTTNPAKIAGISGITGQLKPGYLADFIVTKGNIFDDGIIVSVWTQGQRNNLIEPNHLILQGDYQFTSKQTDKRLTLNIALDDASLKVTLTQGDDKLTVTDVTTSANSVSFVATELGQAIRYRLWQADDGIGLQGRQITQDQQQQLVRATAIDVTKDDDTNDHDEAISYLSHLTSPNRAFGQTTLPQQQKLHLKNATVWTSQQQGILTNTDILIANGRFKKIGHNLTTPSGYRVIDATNQHITAGIIDEHSHIAIARGVNESSEAITAEVRIGDVINPDDIHIYRSLAGGTTTAQLLHGSANPIGGQGQIIQLKWGESAKNMKFSNAPGTIKLALGENVKQSNWGTSNTRYPQTRMGVEALMKDAFQRAKEYQQEKRDYDKLSRKKKRRAAPPRRDYRLEAIAEILASQRHVHIHSYVQSEILMFLRLAQSFDFKVATFTHILEGYKLADEIAKHGAGASTFADWWGYKFEVYDAIPHNACLLVQRGVLTSINSDSRDLQRRLNQEAAKSITYCGMSPQDAWNMVTINPAKQLKIDDTVGSIEKGKQADFVIWDDNPLSVYARVQQTWINGQNYYNVADDERRQRLVRQEKALLLNKLLADETKKESGTALSASEKMLQPAWHCEDNHDTWQQRLDHGVHL